MSGEYFGNEGAVEETNYMGDKRMESTKIGDWSYNVHVETQYKNSDTQDHKLRDYVKVQPQTVNKCRNLIRQNSGAIATDNTGAAVVTINNILSGITNSINRLSELHNCMEVGKGRAIKEQKPVQGRENEESPPSGFMCLKSCSLVDDKKRADKRPKRRSITSLESSCSLIQSRGKNKDRYRYVAKDEVPKGASATSVKKPLKRRVKRLKQLSKTSLTKKNRPATIGAGYPCNHLVEIYHNAAARSSESDENVESQQPTNKKILAVEPKSKPIPRKSEPITPSSPVPCSESRNPRRHSEQIRSLSPIEEQQRDVIDANYGTNFGTDFTMFAHNYETPTIASRMKQVARSYMRQYNSKAIPFCAAASTSPSHNIGINIQQVMNIIKTKQPIKGISATLAHNIGIAAEKLNHQSLSVLVSSFGSKIGYNTGFLPCPMSKDTVNIQDLQEMAKTIDDDHEDQHEDTENAEGDCTISKAQQQTVWAVDPNTQVNCTCIPKQGVAFQHILNRYNYIPQYSSSGICCQGHIKPIEIDCLNQFQNNITSQYSQTIMKRSKQKYKHIKSVYAQNNDPNILKKKTAVDTCQSSGEGSMNLKGKEKVLKGVLVNLHDEFKQLNERYEDLTKSLSSGEGEVNPSGVKELERLEKKLNDKEEEIQMVMSLYTEVVNLKQQVKALREKASLASLMVEQHKQQYQMSSQFSNFQQPYQQQYLTPQKKRNSQGQVTAVAAHLSKLLKQIKSLQGYH